MANEITATLKLLVKETVTTEMGKARKELEQFEKRSLSLRGSVKDLFRELAGPVAGLGVGAAVGMFVKSSLEAASALEALERRAQLVYGSAFPRMAAEAERLGREVHRSGSDMLGFMTDITSLTSGVGIAADAAEGMSEKVAQLAVDFASFANIADEQSFDMIQAALRGNQRALASFNVTMTDNELETYRLAKGYKTAAKDMGDAQLMILRLNFLLDKLSKVQGESARSAGSLANRTKDLSGQWQDFSEIVGKPIGRFVADELGVINTTLRALGKGIRLVTEDWINYGKAAMSAASFGAVQFGSSKKRVGPLSMGEAQRPASALNPDDYPDAPGGGAGGGGQSPGEMALSDVKSLLSDIEKIEQGIAEALGKQAEANKKVQEGRREDLKIRKDLGTLTKAELRDLETLNRRLGDGRDNINELRDAWTRQKDAVGDLHKKVEELNQSILDGAKDLQSQLEKMDRETAKRKGEKVADLLKEKQGLEGQLARAEGLSPVEQLRLASLEETLRGAKYNDASAYAEGEQLAGMNELERLDFEAQEKKKDAVLEFNKKNAEAVDRLTQASLDLAAAQGTLKGLQNDLTTAISNYEMALMNTYKVTEEATLNHVASQVAELQKEKDAVDALARSYANVQQFLKTDQPSEKAAAINGGVTINISAMTIAKEADADEVMKRITREVQKQLLQAP